jgi:hypothetical protein
MHTTQTRRIKPKPARIASWARLWLSCIAALLTCAAHMLAPAQRQRLPLLDLPRTMLAGFVARLIFLCAIEQAAPPRKNLRALRQAGALRAILRTGAHRHLTNADGELDLARIAYICANPDAAIADMIAALACGLTRRSPVVPRASSDHVATRAPHVAVCAYDSS